MAAQNHFPFRTSERMMHDEQSVLNMIPNATTLLFVKKPNHLGRVLDYGIDILPEFLWNHRSLDIESQLWIFVELDVVVLIFGIWIGRHILVDAEKIFVALGTFPQEPSSSKIIFVFLGQIFDLDFQFCKGMNLEHLDFTIHPVILNCTPMKRNGFQQLLQIGGKLEILGMRHVKPL